MPNVQNYKSRNDYATAKPYSVLKAEPITLLAVQFANGDGKVCTCFSYFFGKNPDTGKPRVLVRNEDTLGQNYFLPSDPLEKALLAAYDRLQAEKGAVSDEVPDAMPAMASLGEGP